MQVVESMVLGTVPISSKAGEVLEILEGTRAAGLTFQPDSIENTINKLEILALMNESEVLTLGSEL
jgi:predicted glycosyltransferase